MMESNMVSTIASDSLRGNSVVRMTSSTRSALVMVVSFIAFDSPMNAKLGACLPHFRQKNLEEPWAGPFTARPRVSQLRRLEGALCQNGVADGGRSGGF